MWNSENLKLFVYLSGESTDTAYRSANISRLHQDALILASRRRWGEVGLASVVVDGKMSLSAAAKARQKPGASGDDDGSAVLLAFGLGFSYQLGLDDTPTRSKGERGDVRSDGNGGGSVAATAAAEAAATATTAPAFGKAGSSVLRGK